jgi:hypothetical protein
MEPTPRLSVISPTRGRPQKLIRMATSLLQNADDPGALEILVYVDRDDPTLQEYVDQVRQLGLEQVVKLQAGPSIRAVGSTNVLAGLAKGEVILAFCDDALMLSKSWDTELLKAAKTHPDGYAVLYPKSETGKDWDHWAVTRKWQDLFGYFCFPGFFHYVSDQWTYHIAAHVERAVSVPTVRTQHLHPNQGLGEIDAVYHHSNEVMNYDFAMFERMKRLQGAEAAMVIRAIEEANGGVFPGKPDV